MRTYVWVSFAFMGWAYYEVSGGGDFVPQQRDIAVMEPSGDTQPDVVTRAQTPTLLSVSASNLDASNLVPTVETSLEQDADQARAATVETVALIQDEPAVDPVIAEPVIDIRAVAASRVNMRMGPSTDDDVITTLTQGTDLEVLEINEDGWAKISTLDRGIEGWMSAQFLTDPQT